jgi:Zn-dependent oligopeptidase
MQAVEENSKSSESVQQPIPDPLHIWANLADTNAANAWVEHHLAASRASIAELLAVTIPRTIDNTLVPYDRACWHLRMAGSQSGVMFMVHPLADVRDAAQQLSQVIGAESVALSLNRDVYQALARTQRFGRGRRRRHALLPRPRSPRLPSLRRRQR